MTPANAVTIEPFAAIAGDASAMAALDEIFFATSLTKTFKDASARAAFRERWLGRYLTVYPECCFVAVSTSGVPLGYICGSLQDPSQDPVFADQSHFAAFTALTARYPAQLHINLGDGVRGRGIGGRLIATYVDFATAAGAPGVHAISSRGARNLTFYAANGFPEVGSATMSGKELVFLGRKLG